MYKQNILDNLITVRSADYLVGAVIQINTAIGLTDKVTISSDKVPVFDREAKLFDDASAGIYLVQNAGTHFKVRELFSETAPITMEFFLGGYRAIHPKQSEKHVLYLDELKVHNGTYGTFDWNDFSFKERLRSAKGQLDLCARLKRSLPDNAVPFNQKPLPYTSEELQQIEEMGGDRAKDMVPRRYALTPEKLKHNYESAAAGLKHANYEQKLTFALQGRPGAELRSGFEWMVKNYTSDRFQVDDRFGVHRYVVALKGLSDMLLNGMQRAKDSSYHHTAAGLYDIRG